MTVLQHKLYQDPESEAAKLNSAIDSVPVCLVLLTVLFNAIDRCLTENAVVGLPEQLCE